ncbi:hypothetical protein AB0O34_26715 [Sphaerisporangium sp. NPDC088356]|uniref:hypothetical protein n=1 Tax=Sphaerisporangium sp. NPDC088356 TaxID=3154871 RepID=UPI003426BEB6
MTQPLDTVWKPRADINSWPGRRTDITSARLDGALEPGASSTRSGLRPTVTSTVLDGSLNSWLARLTATAESKA